METILVMLAKMNLVSLADEITTPLSLIIIKIATIMT